MSNYEDDAFMYDWTGEDETDDPFSIIVPVDEPNEERATLLFSSSPNIISTSPRRPVLDRRGIMEEEEEQEQEEDLSYIDDVLDEMSRDASQSASSSSYATDSTPYKTPGVVYTSSSIQQPVFLEQQTFDEPQYLTPVAIYDPLNGMPWPSDDPSFYGQESSYDSSNTFGQQQQQQQGEGTWDPMSMAAFLFGEESESSTSASTSTASVTPKTVRQPVPVAILDGSAPGKIKVTSKLNTAQGRTSNVRKLNQLIVEIRSPPKTTYSPPDEPKNDEGGVTFFAPRSELYILPLITYTPIETHPKLTKGKKFPPFIAENAVLYERILLHNKPVLLYSFSDEIAMFTALEDLLHVYNCCIFEYRFLIDYMYEQLVNQYLNAAAKQGKNASAQYVAFALRALTLQVKTTCSHYFRVFTENYIPQDSTGMSSLQTGFSLWTFPQIWQCYINIFNEKKGGINVVSHGFLFSKNMTRRQKNFLILALGELFQAYNQKDGKFPVSKLEDVFEIVVSTFRRIVAEMKRKYRKDSP